ncbi:MAG TPA: recombinase family protein [Mycobacteriales bacterium]|nr:recombinase family protein [Mycobacteriales bacterium]
MATPRAFGYVRLARANPTEVERMRLRVANHCVREGLALELVFADNGVSDTALVRPAWTALLDVLHQAEAPVVVLPTARVGCGAHR